MTGGHKMSKAMPTPGPWWTDGRYNGRETGCPVLAVNEAAGPPPGNPTRGLVAFATEVQPFNARRAEANARLIAAADTAAHEARKMGYDPIAAVEALPEVLGHLRRLQHFAEDAPRCDFNEDKTLSWISYETAEVQNLRDRISGKERSDNG